MINHQQICRRTLWETVSVCPVCQKRVKSFYIQRGQDVYMEKTCSDHGQFVTLVWRGLPEISNWHGSWDPSMSMESDLGCPDNCGLCDSHRVETCCVIWEVTDRCNLSCPFCFASPSGKKDKTFDELLYELKSMSEKGIRFLHLSGGEPTVRPDLEKLIKAAVELGFEYIQLNTNGIRLAAEPEYVKRLADAGLSCVFLQFDGVSDDVYCRLRGRELFEEKQKAISACDDAVIGVILVPTIVYGINDTQIGDIMRFATEHMPAVKGIHFQPVTYTGRFPDGEKPRFTLPELVNAIEEQSGGLVKSSWLKPSSSDSPLCGFHAELRRDGARFSAIENNNHNSCCCSAVVRSQRSVKNRWTRTNYPSPKRGSIEELLRDIEDSNFSISAMFFQDIYNLDLARVRSCASVHVYNNGKLVPFCIYYNLDKYRNNKSK